MDKILEQLNKVEIRVKQLKYSMNFGEGVEAVVKLSLN